MFRLICEAKKYIMHVSGGSGEAGDDVLRRSSGPLLRAEAEAVLSRSMVENRYNKNRHYYMTYIV
jgi:hypothetical protein